jgi:hypothetical protein
MISEAPPIFVPSGPGFKASYSLTFSSDLDHCIHLLGSLQGDAVSAKTLAVDNGSNSAGCRVTLRGKTVPVPAYAIAYVDCEGALDVVVTGGSSGAAINVDVLTYSRPEQTIIKKNLSMGGLPPPSVIVAMDTILPNASNRILSIGSGVNFYADLIATTTTAVYGYTSTQNLGSLNSSSYTRVLVDTTYQELWINNAVHGDTYKMLAA